MKQDVRQETFRHLVHDILFNILTKQRMSLVDCMLRSYLTISDCLNAGL